MGRAKIIGGLIAALFLAGCGGPRPVRIGAKNFTEQDILGEILAQHVERRLGVPVERRFHLGGTLLAHEALRTGQIDLYPEYTGTALAAVLKQPLAGGDVLGRVRAAYLREFQIEWLNPIGVDNGFAMVVRGSEARKHGLETLSDAARVPGGWALGVGYEFEQRADGLPALDRVYGIPWKGRPRSMDLGLLYQALEQGQVTMIAANATDGQLAAQDLKVLRDDKAAFPPYEVAVAVRQAALREAPGLREALGELSGRFTNERMRALNYQVDGLHRPAAEVAAGFLRESGLHDAAKGRSPAPGEKR
jgi:osmoprotectant transport system substrate-binding protein